VYLTGVSRFTTDCCRSESKFCMTSWQRVGAEITILKTTETAFATAFRQHFAPLGLDGGVSAGHKFCP